MVPFTCFSVGEKHAHEQTKMTLLKHKTNMQRSYILKPYVYGYSKEIALLKVEGL